MGGSRVRRLVTVIALINGLMFGTYSNSHLALRSRLSIPIYGCMTAGHTASHSHDSTFRWMDINLGGSASRHIRYPALYGISTTVVT